MARIRIHDQRDADWISGRHFTPPEIQHHFTAEELNASRVRIHEEGDVNTLQLFEIAFDKPNHEVELHSHSSDEIFYVVKGSFEFGRRSLGPGSSVFVRANTLYAFKTGPEGVQFLNFRPHKDFVYRNSEQHKAWLRDTASGRQGHAGAEDVENK